MSEVIRSLFSQTLRPETIVLTLSKTEFHSESMIPRDLLNLRKDGLRIIFSEKNYCQYKKYLALPPEYEGKAIILVDDDVIYSPSDIEMLFESYSKNQNAVHANRVHIMALDNRRQVIKGYKEWVSETAEGGNNGSHLNFATGIGGVLYPPGILYCERAIDQAMILRYAPYADDVWLKFIALSNNLPVVGCMNDLKWTPNYTKYMSNGALHHFNVDRGLNDQQIQKTYNYFDFKTQGFLGKALFGRF